MTDVPPPAGRVRGTLHAVDGQGVVRLEGRIQTGVEDVWSALTDPARLGRWLGEVDGDLRNGGRFRGRWAATGWEGTGRVEACEPPHRLLVTTRSDDQPDGVVEVTLRPEGDGAFLVLEDRGVPLADVADYGAGDQVHVEDLASYLAGGGRCDARARWQELSPGYHALAAGLVEQVRPEAARDSELGT